RAVEMRDSPIARLLRADVLTRVASDTGAEGDLERSLDEARVVKALLPRNPVAAVVSLDAHLTAACICEQADQQEKCEEMLAPARLHAGPATRGRAGPRPGRLPKVEASPPGKDLRRPPGLLPGLHPGSSGPQAGGAGRPATADCTLPLGARQVPGRPGLRRQTA